MRSPITSVLLYRTPACWRISVGAANGATICGGLPGTAPDAPAGVAQRDTLDHLCRTWGFTGELTWQETNPGWWSAEPAAGLPVSPSPAGRPC
ncbi:hypothetical protein [Actinoplanes derwentensis]|uniref:hypothetical protein n=1 Tax=Actinoplanes derwentensis TaxID=113562 RepID=UPI0012FE3BA1|nr:hypothetical protein [Actinoplanes derwentensis]GID85146.1 hypothetical protein Ade03nite_40700 [Actinoplanes derwentensis]